MTEAMIQRARANAAAAGLTNVNVLEGVIEDLPVESDSIDFVVCICVIDLSPEKQRVFAEIYPKGRCGLRVMMDLADHSRLGPVATGAIALNQDISGKHIHVLVTGLRSAGLVHTVRGPSGGYELASNPSSITALDAVSALEGPIAPVGCVVDATSCPRADRCAARDVWCDAATAVDGVLSGLSLEQLLTKQRAKAAEPLNYST